MSHSARYLGSLAVILTFCGCGVLRGPDPTVELLEAELRWLEDNLYQLDDQLDRCYEQLDSARRNNAILRLELAESKSKTAGQAATKSEEKVESEGDFDELTDDELFEFKSPVVITGEPEDQLDQPSTTPDDTDQDIKEADELLDGEIRIEGVPEPESFPQPTAEPDDPARNSFESDAPAEDPDRVTRILLNRRLTGGYNFDRQSGHEGVMVVIEPQNAYAQYLPVPGEVTVEVLDPKKSGLQARVGKWKFDAVESVAFLKETAMGRGLHLQLPWPSAPPQNEQLVLSVVYETPEGRRLSASKNISVQPTVPALVSKVNQAERQTWSPHRPVKTASRARWQAER